MRRGERASRRSPCARLVRLVRLRPDVNDKRSPTFDAIKPAGPLRAGLCAKLYKNIHHSPAPQPTRLRHFPCSSARRPRYRFRTFTAQELPLPSRHGVDLIRARALFDRERRAFTETMPVSRAVRGSVRAPAVRRAVALDAGLVDTVLAIREGSARRDVHRRRWPSLRGLLPRRHRRDVRPCAGTRRTRTRRAGHTRLYDDAAERDAAWVSRELARRCCRSGNSH